MRVSLPHKMGTIEHIWPDGNVLVDTGRENNDMAHVSRLNTTYTRDDLIRVVLAQQWAVAIACCDPIGWVLGESHMSSDAGPVRRLQHLPCAVDVVDGVG